MTHPISLSPVPGHMPGNVGFAGRKKHKPQIEMPFAEARRRLTEKGFDATVTDQGIVFRRGSQEVSLPKRGPEQLIPANTALQILNVTA